MTSVFMVRVGLLFFASLTSVYAALTIEITQGIEGALPIAVLPFYQDDFVELNFEERFSEIIQADLKRSGQFIPQETYRPSPPRFEPRSFDFLYWRDQGAEHVVIGRVRPLDSGWYRIEVELLDVFKGALAVEGGVKRQDAVLLAKQFRVRRSDFRALAHHISDEIYQRLTGERGIFSTRLVYVTVKQPLFRKVQYQLESSDADGFNPRVLLTSRAPLLSPAWSPDGKRIAYVSFERGRPEIFVQELMTGRRTRVSAYPGLNGAPAWSPDGNQLALSLSKDGNPDIYLLNPRTQSLMRLTWDEAIDTEPAWSPDGQALLFTSDRSGQPQIYKYSLATRDLQRVTFIEEYNARASFTPDKQRIIMIQRKQGRFHVAVQDLRTGQVQSLTTSHLDESPSIAPNGRMVVYGTQSFGGAVLGMVSIDGRVKLTLPAQSGEVREPAWSPFLE